MTDYNPIASYYDIEHDAFRDDVDLYLNLINSGPILEIGAGTGRILHALAAAGFEVWGVEPAHEMVARAKKRAPSLDTLHLAASLDEVPASIRFRAGLLGLNTLWHIPSIDDQLEVLRRVRDRLEPGGWLLVDTSNPLTMLDREASGEVREVFRGRSGNDTVTRYAAAWDDPGRQSLDVSMTFETIGPDGATRREVAALHLRYLYRWELELLVRLAGYEPMAVYGSYDLDPFDAGSERILIQARPV